MFQEPEWQRGRTKKERSVQGQEVVLPPSSVQIMMWFVWVQRPPVKGMKMTPGLELLQRAVLLLVMPLVRILTKRTGCHLLQLVSSVVFPERRM